MSPIAKRKKTRKARHAARASKQNDNTTIQFNSEAGKFEQSTLPHGAIKTECDIDSTAFHTNEYELMKEESIYGRFSGPTHHPCDKRELVENTVNSKRYVIVEKLFVWAFGFVFSIFIWMAIVNLIRRIVQ